jgi:hypothetical protein
MSSRYADVLEASERVGLDEAVFLTVLLGGPELTCSAAASGKMFTLQRSRIAESKWQDFVLEGVFLATCSSELIVEGFSGRGHPISPTRASTSTSSTRDATVRLRATTGLCGLWAVEATLARFISSANQWWLLRGGKAHATW